MALEVARLRARLERAGETGELALAWSELGFWPGASGARCPSGALTLRQVGGVGPGRLGAGGMTDFAGLGEQRPVCVDFTERDGLVASMALVLGDRAAPLPAEWAAGLAGMKCAPLPGAAAVNTVRVHADGGRLFLDGSGPDAQLAAVCTNEAAVCGVVFRDGDGPDCHVLVSRTDLEGHQLVGIRRAAGPLSNLPQRLPAGTWLVWPGGAIVPVRDGSSPAVQGSGRRDGLGRALPHKPASPRPLPVRRRTAVAVAGAKGFTVVAPVSEGRRTRGWGVGVPDGGEGVTVSYRASPLSVTGTFTQQPASPPYRSVLGGVLLVDTGTITGSAVGAYVVPGEAGTQPSVFAFGALGSDKGIGPPPFQVRGVALGLGWNSRLRLPEDVEAVADFPFLVALDDPGAIGGAGGDPVEVLRTLTAGEDPWVRPAQDEAWVAAGLAFSCFDTVFGRALAAVQTGPDLAIALLGIGSAELPRGASKKFAKAEIAIEAVLKPKAGEMRLSAALTPASFVIDPNCRLRGGATLSIWYGPSEQAGDFVLSLGGYHPNYKVPAHYPVPTRLGFDWDLAGNVTVSGNAYFAVTPSAVMLGGGLDVQFHSGMLRAWLTAGVDALIQWKPFAFDVGIRVRVGVQARVKILFVTLSITIEVGVSLRVFGPPTGGEATVHLWFIEFTIRFGARRDSADDRLDWEGFKEMLPPPDNLVRIHPGPGLISDGAVGDGSDEAWLVTSAGFTFTVDSAVPITELYLDSANAPTERGDRFGVRPMRETGRTSTQRVTLALEGAPVLLSAWDAEYQRTAVPQSLWGTGSPGQLPSPGGQLVHEQLTGVRLVSPAAENGASTGYISAEHLAFDPMEPGTVPLDADAEPTGPIPRRLPGGEAIGRIADTVDASSQRAARSALADALTTAGVDLGTLDQALPGYVRASQISFTAAPLLVPAG
ncbi:DUF6603 domain-containing protein [Streptomyces noursei]|uniref:DUF6603 domain-containing protein n=1 Tax=Streptomyces noursei TaxID=1971 RepID=UPI0035DB748B